MAAGGGRKKNQPWAIEIHPVPGSSSNLWLVPGKKFRRKSQRTAQKMISVGREWEKKSWREREREREKVREKERGIEGERERNIT